VKNLKGKKQINLLFSEGNSLNAFPFRIIYFESSETALGVSVGKRNFKLAVHRNRIKRQMREAAKQHLWPVLSSSPKKYILMIIYTGKEHLKWGQMIDDFQQIVSKFKHNVL
jgi:ribonuclease P protein component